MSSCVFLTCRYLSLFFHFLIFWSIPLITGITRCSRLRSAISPWIPGPFYWRMAAKNQDLGPGYACCCAGLSLLLRLSVVRAMKYMNVYKPTHTNITLFLYILISVHVKRNMNSYWYLTSNLISWGHSGCPPCLFVTGFSDHENRNLSIIYVLLCLSLVYMYRSI